MSPKVETFQHDSNLSRRRKKGEVTLNRISPPPLRRRVAVARPGFPFGGLFSRIKRKTDLITPLNKGGKSGKGDAPLVAASNAG
jgi:hypothetical protein